MQTRTLLVLGVLLGSCEEAPMVDTAPADPATMARGAPSVLATLTITTDRGADGTPDRVERSGFDDRGDRVLVEEDADGDGLFEKVTAYRHGYEDDRLVVLETDHGADGTIEVVRVLEYDPEGRLEWVADDTDGDAVPDRVEERWYEGERLVRHTIDEPVGGPVETDQRWVHDAQGRAVEIHRERPGGATVHRQAFGADGQIAEIWIDAQADGRPDTRIVRDYDDGRLVSIRTDAGGDGRVDDRTRYGYDADGRLVTVAVDLGDDGQDDTVIERAYSGFEWLPGPCR